MLFNIQSLNKRNKELISLLEDQNVHLAFITETWLMEETNTVTALIKESGYEIIHDFRSAKLGGGAAIIFKDGYSITRKLISCNVTTFEFTAVLLKENGTLPILAVCIYRPGSEALTNQFITELDNFLSIISSKYNSVLLCGDFNVHFENVSDSLVCECVNTLQSYGFIHHLDKPTPWVQIMIQNPFLT